MNHEDAKSKEKEMKDKGQGTRDKGIRKNLPSPLPPSRHQFPDGWIEIGTIVAPQGLSGEVRVRSNSDFPERFEVPGKRWLWCPGQIEPQPVELIAGRNVEGKNLYVVKLAGVSDRNRAEELRGYKLLVLESDRPQLADDEYHVLDLIGLSVYLQESGEFVGTVVDLLSAGHDLLEVQLHTSPDKGQRTKDKGQKTVLIPFVTAIVPIVDLEAGRVEITPPLGLLEIHN
ncbi:ribosome maturation factor RimM [Scytonema sp. UIC 10036]|uniref:ribosome maturation factor RimM n=1 Tax=Scytonema sp. UIC 10036 TaxID=2304196 RepID=UPI0012DAA1B6|nr:ribosome maturation factor RimM [Scytonema sp. UIC 10036]MUG94866.1 ribosome maturation factor RimM [Scytonema sp. UIC 10036]